MVEMGALSKESCRKKASEQFITLWCQAIADGNSREFENDWGLVFETLKKKRRRDKFELLHLTILINYIINRSRDCGQ